MDSEIALYASQTRIHRSENPLLWWQENKKQLPRLAALAQTYLGALATSVASERLFSTAGQILSSTRSRLLPDNVEKLLF